MPDRRRRVALTGIGAITPIGIGRDALWAGIRAERSAVRTLTRFDPSPFRSRVAAQVDDFHAADHLEARRAKRLDRFAQFSVAAARLALADAGTRLAAEDPERVGAMMGTALGGVGYAEEQLARYLAQGLRAVDATLALAVFGGAASCNIAIEFGVSGPNSTNAMSCASGTMAIGEAMRQIRHGYADVMLAGGVEAPLFPLCYGAFALIRAMSARNDDPARASRPFDRDRDGFVMGEGAVVLVLEAWDRAVARGARIYAEVCGYGTTNDGHHMTAPLPTGAQAARAMRLALADAAIAPAEIGYINAHGSSTPLNDPSETRAIKEVFDGHAHRIPVSGTKGYYGHALGASGAFEAAICAMAFGEEWIPPTVNLDTPDPACDLDYVPRTGRPGRVEHVMSNSFGFGGINAVLVLRRPG
ncbi:MAG TPA: beta-ketoacyl-ACP synthase II [Gemmatimonadaceae bacterium]|nr:beta-ketoacyl-ACP synthase II [Gemmatimonadaceae bacterium]